MPSDKTATAREILRRNITAVNNRNMNANMPDKGLRSAMDCSLPDIQ
jgi:hypothetical protein